MSRKLPEPYFKPKLGQKTTILVPVNFKERYEKFVAMRGRKPYYDDILDLYYDHEFGLERKPATIIKVSPKGFQYTVQDEEGRIIRYRYTINGWNIIVKDILVFA